MEFLCWIVSLIARPVKFSYTPLGPILCGISHIILTVKGRNQKLKFTRKRLHFQSFDGDVFEKIKPMKIM